MSHELESILGNRSATYVLMYLQQYGEGHATHIARTFDVSIMGIQRQMNRLQNSGVLKSRMVGRTRVFTFNDQNPTVRSLQAFLHSELSRHPNYILQARRVTEHD